tara:strand:- start:2957 stop:3256 length:300 start_codon:yes stop_codon:yes gene_type:complete
LLLLLKGATNTTFYSLDFYSIIIVFAKRNPESIYCYFCVSIFIAVLKQSFYYFCLGRQYLPRTLYRLRIYTDEFNDFIALKIHFFITFLFIRRKKRIKT